MTPDWKEVWSTEVVITRELRARHFVRRNGRGYGFDEDVFHRTDDMMRYVFLWVGKLRQPADPPVVEILCHLLPQYEATFRQVDLMILQRAFEEMV